MSWITRLDRYLAPVAVVYDGGGEYFGGGSSTTGLSDSPEPTPSPGAGSV